MSLAITQCQPLGGDGIDHFLFGRTLVKGENMTKHLQNRVLRIAATGEMLKYFFNSSLGRVFALLRGLNGCSTSRALFARRDAVATLAVIIPSTDGRKKKSHKILTRLNNIETIINHDNEVASR
jgi:hypothetical protein